MSKIRSSASSERSKSSREGGSECTVGTRIGATVGKGGGGGGDPRQAARARAGRVQRASAPRAGGAGARGRAARARRRRRARQAAGRSRWAKAARALALVPQWRVRGRNGVHGRWSHYNRGVGGVEDEPVRRQRRRAQARRAPVARAGDVSGGDHGNEAWEGMGRSCIARSELAVVFPPGRGLTRGSDRGLAAL